MFSFFFSSRRRHTRLQGDWSSNVCSSDLYSRAGSSFLVKFLAWQSALFKKLLPALEYFLLCIKCLLRLLRISLGFLNFLGKTGGRGGLVTCLSLLVGTLGILRSGG